MRDELELIETRLLDLLSDNFAARDEEVNLVFLETLLFLSGESEEYLVFLLEEDRVATLDDLESLILEEDGTRATFVLEDFPLVFLTDVFVDFLSLVLLVLSAFCASTVKAKNNIANKMLKFFMTFSFS